MWSALMHQFGVGLADGSLSFLPPLSCAKLSGISLGGDGCETNIKLWKHITWRVLSGQDGDEDESDYAADADDTVDTAAADDTVDKPVQVVISKSCVQHATALVESLLARILDIDALAFCVAKQFSQSSHNKLAEEASYDFIDSRLRWIQAQLFFDQQPMRRWTTLPLGLTAPASHNCVLSRRRLQRAWSSRLS